MAGKPTRAIDTAGALPGDLIAFSAANLLGDVINVTTLGKPRWDASHVGIVTRIPGDRQLCLAESTTLNDRPCLVRHARVSGCQLQPLAERVNEFRGRVWHYPLRIPLGPPLERELHAYLIKLIKAATPYDMIGAIRSRTTIYALIQRWKYGKEDLHSIFCSELVAAAWSRFDIFKTTNASGWNPNALVRESLRQEIIQGPNRWK